MRIVILIVLAAGSLFMGCGDANESKSGASSAPLSCTEDSDCGVGYTCVMTGTVQQALCPAGELEVCYDDWDDPCVPDGPDDEWCTCECTQDFIPGMEEMPTENDPTESNDPPSSTASGQCTPVETSESEQTTETVTDPAEDPVPTETPMCVEADVHTQHIGKGTGNYYINHECWFGEDGMAEEPVNCFDGTYVIHNGECLCTAKCNEVAIGLGDRCDGGSNWICTRVAAGDFCLPPAVDFCQ